MIAQKLLRMVVIILLFAISFMCCKDDNPTEPNYDAALVGNWKISKMTWEGQTGNGSYDQSQLDSNETVWRLSIKSDKTAEQITNYCCALTTHTGTWSATSNELTLKLSAQGSMDIIEWVYQFVIEGGKLVLNWSETGTIYFAEFTKQ